MPPLAAVLLSLFAWLGAAHTDTISYPSFEVDAREVRIEMRMRIADLAGFVDFLAAHDLAPGAPKPRPNHDDVLGRRFTIEQMVLPGIVVFADGRRLESSLDAFETSPGSDKAEFPDDLVVRMHWKCDPPMRRVRIEYRPFAQHDPRHRGLGKIRIGGIERPQLFQARAPFEQDLELSTASKLDAVKDYFLLGMEHVFTGYDHLMFLAALILAARRYRDVLLVATGFTAAHSITLAGAALGWLSLSSRIVEPAIALSVAYVGVENWLRTDQRGRSWVAAGFGLIHGMGFAGALGETGLPAGAKAACLASFNVGVEAAQATVICITLPLLLLWRERRPELYQRIALRGGSAIIAVAGAVWFVARVL